ncbi:RNA polymerase subunit sigma-70 [Nocardioides sp. R1-1]|uniref:RNA polymerase subunit sigma-70 n=1 Tax=Nocardioides sp. R1-1 TaxID=3383502 RepID=UPI0038D09BC5
MSKQRGKRRKVEVENDEFMQFARRIVRAAGKRVGDGEPVDLAALVAVRVELEEVEVRAVQAMRERYGWSWFEIGRELGITRQAAQQRYGRKIARSAS